MNIIDLETLLLTNAFFKSSNLYEDSDEEGEVIKQTKKDFKYDDIDIEVNMFLETKESACVELNLAELQGDLDEEEFGESVELFILNSDISSSLKAFLTLNTGGDFSNVDFGEVNAVTPKEGIVEIMLDFN